MNKASGGRGGRRGGQGTGGVRGGKVNPPKAANGGPKSAKFVSGSSQLIASSVSSGLATNVAVTATSRKTVKNPKGLEITPPVVGQLAVPLALKVRGDLPFNNIVKVSEIELLEGFEGGGDH